MTKTGKDNPTFVDLTYQTFGKLYVTEKWKRENKKTYWWCICECGIEKWITSNQLRVGKTKSCGCYKQEQRRQSSPRKYSFIDYIGKKINRITILSESKSNNKLICQCDCGNIFETKLYRVINNHTRSCGCMRVETNILYLNKKGINIRRGKSLSKKQLGKISLFIRKVKDVYPELVCDICNSSENIHLHHLYGTNNKPELAFEKDNLIPLCNKCHNSFHTSFGYGMNTPLQYLEYIETLNLLDRQYNEYVPQTSFVWR